jgi:hypothetical protein
MPRKYSDYSNERVVGLLHKLTDNSTDATAYNSTLYQIGQCLGDTLLSAIRHSGNIMLVSTVEDTDNLGKGILEKFEAAGRTVLLSVYWNKRTAFGANQNIKVAPIIKEFKEYGDRSQATLIIIKSIISSSCVIRTNLTRVIEEYNPAEIFVVAPVLLDGSLKSLESEFDANISKQFKYIYFAVDDEKTNEGLVIPGIGGDIYQRLGYGDQDSKNRHIPDLVKQRRFKKQTIA